VAHDALAVILSNSGIIHQKKSEIE
jgi:hypothetical protein